MNLASDKTECVNFVGTVVPPTKSRKNMAAVSNGERSIEHMQREFTTEELTPEFIEKLKNRPILFEHSGEPIGTIMDAKLTNGGALVIRGQVQASKQTIAEMRSGNLHALSLAHEYKMYRRGNSFVVSKEPLEVSVCVEGARDGCWLSVLNDDVETGQVLMSANATGTYMRDKL